jgi:perosamine synthetase
MKIIPVSEPNISKKEILYVTKAVKSGWVSSIGEYVEKFEKGFAMYCGRKYGLSVSNGTVALHLALLALGIKKDDEVIVPNFAFIAVANAVIYCGAIPVPVDAQGDTWNIDPKKIEAKITSKTKAIMVVHTYGNPCEMDSILEIAKKHNLYIVEDAAEAHGAEYKGKKIGSFGDISCFSFYGNKTITTGEGGMCLTDNKELFEKMAILRDHGMRKEKKYWHEVVGYNYRITNLQAALGCAQLESLDKFVNIKRKNAALYMKLLKDVSWLELPVERLNVKNIYWMFSVLVKDKKREFVIEKLKEAGIDSRVFFYPICDMPPYQDLDKNNLEVSKMIAYQGINLPSSTKLSKKDIEFVCKVLKEI